MTTQEQDQALALLIALIGTPNRQNKTGSK